MRENIQAMAETQSIAAGAAPTRLVRAALPAAYVGAWAFLGLAGAGYIGTLVLRPDLLLAGERTGEAR